MKLQMFKGTYAVLLLLAIAGLFLMLRRQAGDGFGLTMWIGVIALCVAGMVAAGQEAIALVEMGAGLVSTAYLKFGGLEAVSVAGRSLTDGGMARVDLTLGAYLIIVIVLAIIWRARRTSPAR